MQTKPVIIELVDAGRKTDKISNLLKPEVASAKRLTREQINLLIRMEHLKFKEPHQNCYR